MKSGVIAQNTIAVIFDFDDTLAPDSTSGFLHSLGLDVPSFWQNRVQPLIDEGWDPIPAYLYMMLKVSREEVPITRNMLRSWGNKVTFYEGTTRIFNRLQRHVEGINPDIRVEFYIISSGIGEVIRNTRIAKHFTDIWTCDFHYDSENRICFPKNVISFTDKTRYLFHISKYIIGPDSRSKPFEVNKKIKPHEFRIPFEHMIYVGDGYTDIPCFSLVRKNGGIAIGVFNTEEREKWGRAWGFIEDGRVSNLAPTGMSAKSALAISLMMATENIANKITLKSQTYQG